MADLSGKQPIFFLIELAMVFDADELSNPVVLSLNLVFLHPSGQLQILNLLILLFNYLVKLLILTLQHANLAHQLRHLSLVLVVQDLIF